MTMTHSNVMRLGAALLCLATSRPMVTAVAKQSTTVEAPARQRAQVTGYVMDDSNIRTAVAAWLSNSASAELTYGHIST